MGAVHLRSRPGTHLQLAQMLSPFSGLWNELGALRHVLLRTSAYMADLEAYKNARFLSYHPVWLQSFKKWIPYLPSLVPHSSPPSFPLQVAWHGMDCEKMKWSYLRVAVFSDTEVKPRMWNQFLLTFSKGFLLLEQCALSNHWIVQIGMERKL